MARQYRGSQFKLHKLPTPVDTTRQRTWQRDVKRLTISSFSDIPASFSDIAAGKGFEKLLCLWGGSMNYKDAPRVANEILQAEFYCWLRAVRNPEAERFDFEDIVFSDTDARSMVLQISAQRDGDVWSERWRVEMRKK